MAALEEFKALREGVVPQVQIELVDWMSSDPEAGKQRIVEIAAAQGVTLTTEEVRGFLLQMGDEEAFDDIELDPIALIAIAGGQRGRRGNCCQEEAHDEPWGRCPDMRRMRRLTFGRQPVAHTENLD